MHWVLWTSPWYWFVHVTGTDNGGKYGHWNWYNFWSGFESDIVQIALLGGLIQLYRRHNCCVHKCWRIAKITVEGTGLVVCIAHRPDVKEKQRREKAERLYHLHVVRRQREARTTRITHTHVVKRYEEHLERVNGNGNGNGQ